jgi:transglutaminase-like putative cysteine protease
VAFALGALALTTFNGPAVAGPTIPGMGGTSGGGRGPTLDPSQRPPAPTVPGAGSGTGAGGWVRPDPDMMAGLMLERVKSSSRAGTSMEGDALSALSVLYSLRDRARFGIVQRALESLAADRALGEVAWEAEALARGMAPDRTSTDGATRDHRAGLAKTFFVLGPFRDTGGGLDRKDGPEQTGASYEDERASFAWGAYDVRWREIPTRFATFEGLPLDVWISPRNESCTLLATKWELASDETFVVRIAAAGQVRAWLDDVEVGRSEDVHAAALFDRIGAKVTAKAGAHALRVKVCSGALADSGRVRVRTLRPNGDPFSIPVARRDAKGSPASAVTVVRTPTLLERVTAAKAAPLASLLVRSIAGADDLRSPRAPGLASVLAQGDAAKGAARPSEDVLALLSVYAPSHPVRSALLGRVYLDRDVNRFVTLRAAEARARADQSDWALAAAQGMQLGSATLPHEVDLMAQVELGQRSDALRVMAYNRLRTLFEQGRDSMPNAALDRFYGLALGLDRQRALEAAREFSRRGMAVPLPAIAATMSEGAILTEATQRVEGTLTHGKDAAALLRLVSPLPAATPLVHRLLQFAPNRADVVSEWANAMLRRGDRTAYLEGLKRARELDPGSARLREELARAPAKDGARETDPKRDEQYLVPSETVLARRGSQEGGNNVADRELYWLRAVTMHDDARVSQLIQYAREVVIAPRTQDELFEDMPLEGDLTEILRARVHRKGGGVSYPTEEHNEGRRPRIRWPDLSPGDVVEVALRSWTSTPVGGRGDSPFYFVDYAGAPATHPLLYNEVVVDSPESRPLYVDVIRGGDHQRTERKDGGRKVLRLVWKSPPRIPEEPLSPPMSEIAPLIVGSTYRSWNEFRAWYAEAVKGFTEPDEEVRQIAKDLTKKESTQAGKVRALFNFVADDIRYVNYVSGEWWLPNRPQQLLARREGDCDDKAILLISLLKAIGVEAQEVLVQTRLTGMPSVLRAPGAAIPMFDHGIAFLPGPGGGTYLDATSPESRMGALPSMDARGSALRMAGSAEIVTLPESSPDDHGADVTWQVQLRADGGAEIQAEETHRGDSAFWLRTALRQEGARQQYVQDNLVSGWFSNLKVDGKIGFEGDLAGGRASVKYRATSPDAGGVGRTDGNSLVVRLSPSATLASALAPFPTRTLPVVLPSSLAPSKQRRVFEFRAPKGYVFTHVPPGDSEEGGEFGRAKLQTTSRGEDVVRVERIVVFDAHVIAADKYPAFRAWLLRVDGMLQRALRLMPQAKKGEMP